MRQLCTEQTEQNIILVACVRGFYRSLSLFTVHIQSVQSIYYHNDNINSNNDNNNKNENADLVNLFNQRAIVLQ